MDAARLQLGDIIGSHSLQESLGTLTSDPELAHVRDIENPRCRAYSAVFL